MKTWKAFLVQLLNIAGTGPIFGAIIVGIINNIQTLLGVDSNIQRIVKGAIIVISVIIDVVTKNSAKKAR